VLKLSRMAFVLIGPARGFYDLQRISGL